MPAAPEPRAAGGPPPAVSGREALASPADGSPVASWFLLPVAWCAAFLLVLVPSLLLAPHTATAHAWVGRGAAPAAVVLAGAFFLVAVWPFWPALAAGRRVDARWLGRSALELAALAALAAPFVLVAWSVSGRTLDVWPLALAMLELAALGMGLRIAATAAGQGGTRWLMLAATLVAAGPILLEYAVSETMGVTFPRVLEASPMVSAMDLALGGWPAGAWPVFARLILWPAVGAALAVAGLVAGRRRAAA